MFLVVFVGPECGPARCNGQTAKVGRKALGGPDEVLKLLKGLTGKPYNP